MQTMLYNDIYLVCECVCVIMICIYIYIYIVCVCVCVCTPAPLHTIVCQIMETVGERVPYCRTCLLWTRSKVGIKYIVYIYNIYIYIYYTYVSILWNDGLHAARVIGYPLTSFYIYFFSILQAVRTRRSLGGPRVTGAVGKHARAGVFWTERVMINYSLLSIRFVSSCLWCLFFRLAKTYKKVKKKNLLHGVLLEMKRQACAHGRWLDVMCECVG
jgi:hypothetical protein